MEELIFQEKVGKFLDRYGKVKFLREASLDGSDRILPFIVENEDQKFAVFAFHWKKSIGTNTIIRTEHKISDMNCDGAIVIGNRFSQNSYDMVSDTNKRGNKRIILIKMEELDEILSISGY
ncbi:MAG: hypothetical protein KAS63_05565 [Candidatus Heimdallarchaeota archaeon]|nr:hypothetical protein [Candidatus Heimdallarchaeota archaeon]MCK4954806.1 hypothetical protein [Candidatus Heimdallarchaeota archaeon]